MTHDNWIDDLVSEADHVETPLSWLWWSFCAAISAAAGNNYYLSTLRGDLVYKPNLYIILLGESGLGKGFPINRSKLLVNKADVTRVIAGRSSIQAIVKELATSKSRKDKPPMTDSRGFIVNGELSTAIIADPDSLTILTDLYDGHYNPEWTNLLKMDGAEKLKEPYITCLFGSSPAHFYDSIPQANIEGGYIGRNLIIYEEKRSKDTDLLDDESEIRSDVKKFDEKVIPKFVPHLVKIAASEGRLVPSNEARNVFNKWRSEWRKKQEHDKTGFFNRVPDHVLKVAMCICLARYNTEGVIDEVDMAEAIRRVTGLIYANRKTVEGRGLDPGAILAKMVIDYLIAAHDNHLTRQQLMKKGYGNYDAAMLDKVLDHLLEMGWVKRERITAGKASDWEISLAGEPLTRYKQYLAGKNGSVNDR